MGGLLQGLRLLLVAIKRVGWSRTDGGGDGMSRAALPIKGIPLGLHGAGRQTITLERLLKEDSAQPRSKTAHTYTDHCSRRRSTSG